MLPRAADRCAFILGSRDVLEVILMCSRLLSVLKSSEGSLTPKDNLQSVCTILYMEYAAFGRAIISEPVDLSARSAHQAS
jgi:hypothetical protein